MVLPIDLHDATLLTVVFEWARGHVTLAFRTTRHGEVSVRVEDCSDLHVPRLEEWGRSVSVLSVNVHADPAAPGIEVEMQSGDRIVAKGRVTIVGAMADVRRPS